jgi:antitoxin (DNA-binding transcriptional repressor) of toxin-antitoxin stability system
MKTVTTREVQHHFSRVLNYVEAGEEVQVTRRNKVVARIVLPEPVAKPRRRKVKWPDFRARMTKIFGDKVFESNAILEERASYDT